MQTKFEWKRQEKTHKQKCIRDVLNKTDRWKLGGRGRQGPEGAVGAAEGGRGGGCPKKCQHLNNFLVLLEIEKSLTVRNQQ